MKTMLKRGVVGAAALAIAGSMLAIGAGSASAGHPALRTGSSAVGSLNFYNSAGFRSSAATSTTSRSRPTSRGRPRSRPATSRPPCSATHPRPGSTPARGRASSSACPPRTRTRGTGRPRNVAVAVEHRDDRRRVTGHLPSTTSPTPTRPPDGYAGLYELRSRPRAARTAPASNTTRTDIQFNNVTIDASGAVTGGTWTVATRPRRSSPAPVSAITAQPGQPRCPRLRL